MLVQPWLHRIREGYDTIHVMASARQVANAVGIGAIKYADLSTERNKDYVFNVDRKLNLDGNTAGYLQYARARGCSILHRSGVSSASSGGFGIVEPSEHRLAIELLGFASVVGEVAQTLEFHRLTGYLHRLATAFSS